MTAQLLNGKALAASIRKRLKGEAEVLALKGMQPGLAVILVGDDPASEKYVATKERTCEKLGIRSEVYRLSAEATEEAVLRLVRKINADPRIHGLLIQRPLPEGLDTERLTASIDPAKDVDCFHPCNVGKLVTGDGTVFPCTPQGVMVLLEDAGFRFEGARAVVVGRSVIVGKPLALMLLERNCTVTLCHSRTKDLAAEVGRADLVVAAVGRPALVKGSWIRPGAWVVDVGTNVAPDGSLVGDVEYEAAAARASHITPVPGGVGPMTIAMLMQSTVNLARRALDAKHRDAGPVDSGQKERTIDG